MRPRSTGISRAVLAAGLTVVMFGWSLPRPPLKPLKATALMDKGVRDRSQKKPGVGTEIVLIAAIVGASEPNE